MKLQRTVILLLVLALVVGLEAVLMNVFVREEDSASGAPVPTPESTADASVATPTAVPTIVPTMPGFTSPPLGWTSGNTGGNSSNNSSNNNNSSSQQTKKPSPTQAPATPKPTEPPPPTQAPGTILGSNSFSSNTGTSLNLNVSWEARDQGNGKCRVYITGTVSSYSLQVISHPVTITFGDYSTSVNGSSLNVSSGGMKTSNLFSTYLDVPSGTEGDMTVSWRYKGTYGDVEIDSITATGPVYTS